MALASAAQAAISIHQLDKTLKNDLTNKQPIEDSQSAICMVKNP